MTVALRFSAVDDGLTAQFRRVIQQMETFQSAAQRAGSLATKGFGELKGLVAGLSFAVVVREVVQFADQLTKAAAQTGIAVEALQRLQFVAAQTDTDIGSITGAVNKMQRALVLSGEGSEQAAASLARLNIPIEQFQILSPDQQFESIARAIASIQNPAEKVTAAIGLFGRSGAELIPVLDQVGGQLAVVDANFDKIGGAVSADVIARVDDMGDSFDALTVSLKSFATEAAGLLVPIVKPAIDAVSESVGSLRRNLFGGEFDKLREDIRILEEARDSFAPVFFTAGDRFGTDGVADVLLGREAIEQRILELKRRQFEIEQQQSQQKFVPTLQSITFNPEQIGGNVRTQDPARARARNVDTRTEQERRLDAGGPGEQFSIATINTDELEAQNQEHLNRLLEQTTAYVTDKVRIESEGLSLLSSFREAIGAQDLTIEQSQAEQSISIKQSLVQSAGTILNAAFGGSKKFAIAQAVIATAQGAAQALRDVPFPANFAAAAAVVAQGTKQIQAIKASNPGGSGSVFSGGSGSISANSAGNQFSEGASTLQAPTGATGGTVLQVIVNGSIFSATETADFFIDTVKERINDFDEVIINSTSRQAAELAGG